MLLAGGSVLGDANVNGLVPRVSVLGFRNRFLPFEHRFRKTVPKPTIPVDLIFLNTCYCGRTHGLDRTGLSQHPLANRDDANVHQ